MAGYGFIRESMTCECGCGFDVLDYQLKIEMEDCLFEFVKRYPDSDIQIKVTGGNRCAKHNKDVGGADKSQHIFGKALDFRITNISIEELFSYMVERHSTCYGIGRYTNRIHFDIREGKARWSA